MRRSVVTNEHGHIVRCIYCRCMFTKPPTCYAERGPFCQQCADVIFATHKPFAASVYLGRETFGDRSDEIADE